MTFFSAQTIDLEKRGVIRLGHYADVLVFYPNHIKTKATYENSHQLASGFDYVFVNGQIVYE